MPRKNKQRPPRGARPPNAAPTPAVAKLTPVVATFTGFTDATLAAPASAPIDRLLRAHFAGSSWNAVRALIESGKVTVDGLVIREPQYAARAGSELKVSMRAPRAKGPALPADLIVHLDSQVVVVKKPPGISTVPFDETETGTLSDLVEAALKRKSGPQPPLGIVHRIDKDTSGLVVFARTLAARRALKQQFRVHSVRRRYLALAYGTVPPGTLHSRLVQDRGDGHRGSTDNPTLGREAVTHVRVLEELGPATLVECRLETGRTHQIRIHLAESGHPLVGERVYARYFTGASISAPRMMLHAAELGFEHPSTGEPLLFEQPMPEDMRNVLAALRLR